MEETEDLALLNSLGIATANPEEIERFVLEKAHAEEEAGKREFDSNKEEDEDESHKGRRELSSKLRAVEIEIDAVKANVQQSKTARLIDDRNSSEDDDEGNKTVSANGIDLQKAIAAERLKSLKQTRNKLRNELSILGIDGIERTNVEHDKVLLDLVKEGQSKKKLKWQKPPQATKKLLKEKKVATFTDDADFDAVLDGASMGFVETERDKLIRKGLWTPFHKLKGFERGLKEPEPSDNKKAHETDDGVRESNSIAKAAASFSRISESRPTTKLMNVESLPKLAPPTSTFHRLKKILPLHKGMDTEKQELNKSERKKRKRPLPDNKWRKYNTREERALKTSGDQNSGSSYDDEDQEKHDDRSDDEFPSVTLEGGLRIPESIFGKLFDYQRVGVQWLWELHCQRAGGIIGDEMGLGKTIQVISFLAALHYSKMYKPSIVLCPVTLLHQWKREVLKWYPDFQVEILHDSAQVSRSKQNRKKYDESSGSEDSSDEDSERPTVKSKKNWDLLINRVVLSESGLLITTYEQLRLLGEVLLDIEWGYAILDEGHRIRNPNADITLVCKQLQTVHRIIMTGAPIQNRLTELWSLFDFVFPGKLGVLPVFEAQFAVPISVGGYANATPLQVSTAYRCAVVLRDLVMPYLLRRMKADVNAHLPAKTEHVLFCSLTSEQRSVYRAFLASSEVEQIFEGSRRSLYGIDVMRKICNHPDLLEREQAAGHPDYGNPARSGKMKVVSQVLRVWKDQGHRVLLFSQTQQMLDILQNFVVAEGYTYRRMDGFTPVKQRMVLIDEFNNSTDVYIFILTTKVGGLGTNLTGADRVIIYDPDWNPSTDAQARERAWRIGQTKDVTIYRLITRGTIEEKMYHRQIYKHFLTNKILKNPQQRRFFKARDMRDLFAFKDDEECASTETSNIFGQLADDVTVNVMKNNPVKADAPGEVSPFASAVNESTNVHEETKLKKKREGKVVASDDQEDKEMNVLLKSLFDVHGVHSAMDHDMIVGANDEEKLKLEEEATQVAQKAAEALRQSRMLRSQESVSVPTWTGRAGSAGAPSAIRKFGSTTNSRLINSSTSSQGPLAAGTSVGRAVSSAELLARIRGTQESAVVTALEHQLRMSNALNSNNARQTQVHNTASTSSSNNITGFEPQVMISQLCLFVEEMGGSAGSASIIDHFKDKVPSKDLPLFKKLLKEIASLKREPNGSKWVLKPEYKH